MARLSSLFLRVRLRLIEARQDAELLQISLSDTFSAELEAVRGILIRKPFLSVGFAFVAGLVFGGLLQARVARFTLLSLLGGFPMAIVYGQSQGVPTILSVTAVMVIDGFVSYSLLRFIRVLDEYPRIQPYLSRLKIRYTDSSDLFVTYSGRLGVQGALAVCTFLIGWWIATVIAYIMDLDTKTAMTSIVSGLLAGGLLSLSIYEGFIRLIPDPAVVILMFLVVFIAGGLLTGRILRGTSRARHP